METIIAILKWLFIEKIFGILAIAGVIYFVLSALRKVIPAIPEIFPFVISGLTFLVGISTLPSIPRYQFESDALSQVEGKGWVRVINKTKWGDITEPLTWFRAPVGSILAIAPEDPLTDNVYREVLLQYEKQPRVRVVNINCSDRTVWYSEPHEGIFRFTSMKPTPMNRKEWAIYCNYDWSNEKEALRVEAIKQMGQEVAK